MPERRLHDRWTFSLYVGSCCNNYHRSYIVQSYAILRRTYPCQFLLDLIGSMINPSSCVYCSLEHRTDSLFCNNFCFHRDLYQSRSGDQWKEFTVRRRTGTSATFALPAFLCFDQQLSIWYYFVTTTAQFIQTRSQKRRWRTNRCSRACSSPYL